MIIIIYIQLAKQQKPNCKDLQFGFFLYTVFTDWTGDQTVQLSHITKYFSKLISLIECNINIGFFDAKFRAQ